VVAGGVLFRERGMRRRIAGAALMALGAGCTAIAGAPARGTEAGLEAKLGLQLYSLRAQLAQDLRGTLASIRAMGVTQVEVHKTFDLPAAEFRRALDEAGLAARSMMSPFDRLRDDLPAVIADAKALGAGFVVCPWIPHEDGFDDADARRAIEVFTAAGRAIRAAGLRFAYHLHGYEIHLLDRLLRETAPGVVDFEMDVFYVVHGGGDPVALLERHPGRFPLLHLKDMRAGTPTGLRTGKTDPANTVAVGAGVIDMRPIVAAAERAGAAFYFLEDESAAAPENLPRSLAHLRALARGGGR
jgi:sugar phosphate isomerase/epimerase